MIPSWGICAAVATISAGLAGAGVYTAQEWRYEAKISKSEATQAKVDTAAATGALADLVRAAGVISAAAKRYGTVSTTLTGRIDILTKELRDAPALPVDCRPDAFRVRNLRAGIDAANAAATGQPIGPAVPAGAIP